jgi:hypothetical protein
VTDLTRRSFLQQTPVTAAALGVLPAMPALAAASHHAPKASPDLPATSMVVHVNDVATGEMTLLVGAREIVLRDPWLVARFLEAAG